MAKQSFQASGASPILSEDLRYLPLYERKSMLAKLLKFELFLAGCLRAKWGIYFEEVFAGPE